MHDRTRENDYHVYAMSVRDDKPFFSQTLLDVLRTRGIKNATWLDRISKKSDLTLRLDY